MSQSFFHRSAGRRAARRVMYALVALGFVLIYKASGVFNFAQGAMVFFAALTFASLAEARHAVSGWRWSRRWR